VKQVIRRIPDVAARVRIAHNTAKAK